jgi:hypothetical protein
MTNVIDQDIFFYDQQIKKYILQFMAIFSNLKVEIGKKDSRDKQLIPVHLTYGAKDRVVAHIRGDNTQNKLLRLPTLSSSLVNIDLALERMKGQGQSRRFNYLPRGGLLPDDITTVEQRMPVPYNMTMELAMFTSNLDEHFQILEQILTLFNPQLDIQKTDDNFDWTRITTVELMGINNEFNYPSGADRRIIQSSMQFSVHMHLSVPAKLRSDYIKSIQLRVGAVENLLDSSSEVIQSLDDSGYDYTEIFNFDDDVDLP